MRIESLKIKNFKAFENVEIKNLPPLAVFIGANGTGKSTLFGVFNFLQNCLKDNVKVALQKEGGFNEAVTRGKEDEAIHFELKFRNTPDDPLVTYILEIKCTEKNKPFVSSEVLRYRRGSRGKPWHFLDFKNGVGVAIVEENTTATKENEAEREEQTLDSPDILALKGLGQFQKFKTVSEFRKVIENWCRFDFHIEDARPEHEAGYAEHLSSRGDNLALVTKYIYETHRDVFNTILDKMKKRVPGVTHIEAEENYDRVVLKFQDGAFSKSFTAKHVSDGTLKMFAYLLLLNDPNPHPFLCIEEPENQLYPSLMTGLAEEFQEYTKDNGQVFVTTHSPDLLNAVDLDSVFYLVKRNGVTTIKRASEDSTIKALFQAGDPLGALWKQKRLEGVDP